VDADPPYVSVCLFLNYFFSPPVDLPPPLQYLPSIFTCWFSRDHVVREWVGAPLDSPPVFSHFPPGQNLAIPLFLLQVAAPPLLQKGDLPRLATLLLQ